MQIENKPVKLEKIIYKNTMLAQNLTVEQSLKNAYGDLYEDLTSSKLISLKKNFEDALHSLAASRSKLFETPQSFEYANLKYSVGLLNDSDKSVNINKVESNFITDELKVIVAKLTKNKKRNKSKNTTNLSETDSVSFKNWSNDAPYIHHDIAIHHEFKTGKKVVVSAFHGTARADRVSDVFSKKRAIAGPMSYFTSDPELASSYAKGKEDSSLILEDQTYSNWFKFTPKNSKKSIDISRAWYNLDDKTKLLITKRLPSIYMDDNDEIVIDESLENNSNYSHTYLYNLQNSKKLFGTINPIHAAVETWVSSGLLFDSEQDFLKVLKLAGFPMDKLVFDNPKDSFPFVYKAYITMQNPLVTTQIPADVIESLRVAAMKDRSKPLKTSTGNWDKNSITLKEWVNDFLQDKDAFVWTRIPDKVSEIFKLFGYDGIIDYANKKNNPNRDEHPVFIPFESHQIKSAIGNNGNYNRNKNSILLSKTSEEELIPINNNILNKNKSKLFTEWFGKSRVIDDQGLPLIMYHGSKTPQNLDKFVPGGVDGSKLCGDAYGVGSYFTSCPHEASNPVYTGEEGAVFPVYITGNIIDINHPTQDQLSHLTKIANEILLPSDKARFESGKSTRQFTDSVQAREFFDTQRLNWQQFGDGMDRAKPEVISNDNGVFSIEYTDFDATIELKNGKDLSVFFSAVGYDNIQSAGFDGLIMEREGGQKWVIMYNTDGNIKSSIGNSGDYSISRREINKSQDSKSKIQGLFDPLTRTTILIEDNIKPKNAPGVLMHEIGVHLASISTTDNWMETIFVRAGNLVKEGVFKREEFFLRVQKRMIEAESLDNEEAAAYIVEEHENDRQNAPVSVKGWFTDFKAGIKAWMYRQGFLDENSLNAADIAAIARSNAFDLASQMKNKHLSQSNDDSIHSEYHDRLSPRCV